MRLADIELERIALDKEVQEEEKRHKEAMAVLNGRKARLQEQSCVITSGLDLAIIELAEHVIAVSGWLKGGEDKVKEREAAIRDLASGGKTLRRGYYGTKNYDRWSGQGIGPCEYGMCPRHGHVVFRIELTREARSRDLTPEEIDAAIYYLRNIQLIAETKAKAAVA